MEVSTIFITGANGYIGSQLAWHLAQQGFKVTGLCRAKKNGDSILEKAGVKLLYNTISNYCNSNALLSINPDVILHLVSLDHTDSETNFTTLSEININPAGLLLDQCQQTSTKKFIYFSTQQVYGKTQNAEITEGYPINPLNKYGLSHYLSEQIVNYYNHSSHVDCINLRLSNTYGPPLFDNKNCWKLFVNELALSSFRHGIIRLKSDGTPLKDFISINDVAESISALIRTNNNLEHNTFNLSSGITTSLLEAAVVISRTFQETLDKKIKLFIQNKLIDISSVNYPTNIGLVISNKNLVKYTGTIPKTTLAQGIKNIINYLNQNNDSANC